MIWGYVYIVGTIAVTIYVLWIGDREARFAMVTLFAASAFTLVGIGLSERPFQIVSLMVASCDFIVFAVFLCHALTSRRYWTLMLPALQLITCLTHVAKLVAPDILSRVYSIGQGFWAYPQMAIIILAARWHWENERRAENIAQMRKAANCGAEDV
jgi:hypothetical protein